MATKKKKATGKKKATRKGPFSKLSKADAELVRRKLREIRAIGSRYKRK